MSFDDWSNYEDLLKILHDGRQHWDSANSFDDFDYSVRDSYAEYVAGDTGYESLVDALSDDYTDLDDVFERIKLAALVRPAEELWGEGYAGLYASEDRTGNHVLTSEYGDLVEEESTEPDADPLAGEETGLQDDPETGLKYDAENWYLPDGVTKVTEVGAGRFLDGSYNLYADKGKIQAYQYRDSEGPERLAKGYQDTGIPGQLVRVGDGQLFRCTDGRYFSQEKKAFWYALADYSIVGKSGEGDWYYTDPPAGGHISPQQRYADPKHGRERRGAPPRGADGAALTGVLEVRDYGDISQLPDELKPLPDTPLPEGKPGDLAVNPKLGLSAEDAFQKIAAKTKYRVRIAMTSSGQSPRGFEPKNIIEAMLQGGYDLTPVVEPAQRAMASLVSQAVLDRKGQVQLSTGKCQGGTAEEDYFTCQAAGEIGEVNGQPKDIFLKGLGMGVTVVFMINDDHLAKINALNRQVVKNLTAKGDISVRYFTDFRIAIVDPPAGIWPKPLKALLGLAMQTGRNLENTTVPARKKTFGSGYYLDIGASKASAECKKTLKGVLA